MAAASSARVPGVVPPSAAAPAALAGLGNRFVELLGQNLSRADFAGAMAGLVAEAMRVKAVAVLGYERRRDRLVLLADRDLPSEARAALGDGGACPWEIPLRGLRNRRINVIEAAHQNPFVPRAFAILSPKALSIASLPIYYDYEPTGVLLLFAVGGRPFPDAQLQTLSQAIRACARGLREPDGGPVRSATTIRADDGADATAPAPDEAAAGGRARATSSSLHLVESPSAPAAPGPANEELVARIHDLEQELEQAGEEIERGAHAVRTLTASGNALARERDALRQELTQRDGGRATDAAELRSEIAALQDRLLAVDSERARTQSIGDARHTAAQKTIAALEGERDGLAERSQVAESTNAELQAVLTTVRAERDRLTGQVESLTAQVRTGEESAQRLKARHAEDLATIEADRDGWKEQTASVRTQLAQRTESGAALEGELRSALVARDAAVSQLQAARAELERLAPLAEELSGRATQLEAARAGALAENETLRRTLEDDRAARLHAEQGMQTDLAAARGEAERLATALTVAHGELAESARTVSERDAQVAALRQQYETFQQAQASEQQANAALRAEIATLTARVEQISAERERVRDECDKLRAALAETRHRAGDADITHAAALGQLQAEAAELRRQTEMLTADRAGLTERLQRAVEDGRGVARRLAETEQHALELDTLLRQREATLGTVAAEREQLSAQVATFSGQLQAAQEALARAQARDAERREALETERQGWKEQLATAQAELGERTERLAALDRDLQSTTVVRDAASTALEATRDERDQLARLNEELGRTVGELEATRDTVVAERAALRRALADERAGRSESERSIRAELTAERTEAERLRAAATVLQNEIADRTALVAERDAQLSALRNEIENLRQQSADRGVLARHASELGSRVVELEQTLAAAQGAAAGAERQRAGLAEQLEAARRREREGTAASVREQAALRDTLQVLTEERDRLQAALLDRSDEVHAREAAVAELHATLERVRAEITSARAQHDEAAGRLAELSTALEARDAALASVAAERGQLADQLAAARNATGMAEDALATVHAGHAEAQRRLEADRDAWRAQAATARTEAERLSALTDELQRTAALIEAARVAATTECAQAQHALEEARAIGRRREETLSNELEALRAAAAARDSQFTELSQQAEAAQQAQSVAQQANVAAHAELVQATTQLQERDAECQQLRDGQAELERQLALVVATHGEEEQALAQGLQAAREQVAKLVRERNATRAALRQARQDALQAEATAATLARVESELAALRQHAETLTAERAALAERLERAEADRAAHEHRAAAATQQCVDLHQAIDALEHGRGTLDEERTQLRSQLAAAADRVRDIAVECQGLRDERVDMERRLAVALATQGEEAQTLSQGLQAARAQIDQLEQHRAALQDAVTEAQADSAAVRRDLAALTAERATLQERFAGAAQSLQEQAERAAADAERGIQLEQSLASAEARHTALERELARATNEIEHLRQQTADRGLLAHQASALGSQVVDLEQQLAAVRGEAGRAGRERDALAEELEMARDQQSDALATAEREQAAQQAALQRLNDERTRLEAEAAAQQGQIATQRAALAELEGTVEQLRAERAHAEDDARDAAQRVAATHRRLGELSAALQQRDATIGAAVTERTRLAARVAELTSELRTGQEELESLRGRSALDRAAIETERDAWKQQLEAVQIELEQRAALAETLNRKAVELEAAGAAAESDNASLRQALTEARAARSETEQGLRNELVQARTELDRVSGDAAGLLGTLAERDAQLVGLRQKQAAAREAETAWHQTSAALRADVDRLTAESEQMAAERQRWEDTHAASALQLNHELTAARNQQEAALHALAAARQQVATLTKERAALQDAQRQSRRALDDAEAARREAVQRQQAAVEELRQQTETLTAERTMLDERLQRAERAAAADGERLRCEVARGETLTARCIELERTLAAAEARAAEVAEVHAALVEDRAQRERASAAEGTLAERLAATERRLADVTAQVRQRDAMLEAATAERIQLQEAGRTTAAAATDWASQRDVLQQRLQEVGDQLDRERASHAEEMALLARKFAARRDGPNGDLEDEGDRPAQEAGPLVIERAAPLGALVEPAPEPIVETSATPARPVQGAAAAELVILDDGPLRDDACAALAGAGFEVTAFSPTEPGVDELARRKVKCAMLNLGGGAGAWRTLRLLRERASTSNVPVLAYAMTTKAPKGFSFGRADFALWPTDPDRVVERLGRLRPKLRRLLVLSADVDGMSRLREPLTAAGISTSIVLDGKQALEFAAMIDPEAVILHLSPGCPSVARAVIGLRAGDARDLPLLFLLDKAPGAREEAFFASVVLELLGKAGFQFGNLPEEIARVVT